MSDDRSREQASAETIAEQLSALPELLDLFAERHPVGAGNGWVVCSDGAVFSLQFDKWVELKPIPGTVAAMALNPTRPVER